MSTLAETSHHIATKSEWLQARRALLAKEKELTRQRDELARERRELPWVKVDTNYVFDSSEGPVALADLFDGRSQLIVYHFMFDPAWSQGCKSCSLVADHYNPAVIHLAHRDTTLVTVSRAPLDKIRAFQQRMGWTFRWVSSFHNSFNQDFQVSFSESEQKSGLPIYNFDSQPFPISEAPGISVFVKDDRGDVYHTYSTYARGLDILLGVYNLLDMTPQGRDEENIPIMSWVRHHDRYDGSPFVDPWLEQPAATTKSCCQH
jgi:predicted dithiol-disulfide oxidoreductase (DUF899 family)